MAGALGRPDWSLVYQSRSGPPGQAWLEPDIVDHLRALAAGGARDVVVAPIGFVSDHLEIVYDLDLEARGRAAELGLNMVRAETVGIHPRFVSMIRELVLERLAECPTRLHLGSRGPAPEVKVSRKVRPGGGAAGPAVRPVRSARSERTAWAASPFDRAPVARRRSWNPSRTADSPWRRHRRSTARLPVSRWTSPHSRCPGSRSR